MLNSSCTPSYCDFDSLLVKGLICQNFGDGTFLKGHRSSSSVLRMNLIAHSYKAVVSGTAAGFWWSCSSCWDQTLPGGCCGLLLETLWMCAARSFCPLVFPCHQRRRLACAFCTHGAFACRVPPGKWGVWLDFLSCLELLRSTFQNAVTQGLVVLCTNTTLPPGIGHIGFIAKKDKRKKELLSTQL